VFPVSFGFKEVTPDRCHLSLYLSGSGWVVLLYFLANGLARYSNSSLCVFYAHVVGFIFTTDGFVARSIAAHINIFIHTNESFIITALLYLLLGWYLFEQHICFVIGDRK
jgi:hypothetical protein